MNNLEAKDLFYETRFPTQISKIIYLIAYTPIGIVLIILRLSLGFLALIFASTLSDTSTLRNIISRLLCISLGIVIETEDYDKKDENAKLIVSNHVSDLDHIALHAATSSVMPTNYKMQSVLENALGLISINTLITEDVLETLNKPIAVLPEDTVTNGKAILKFKSHVFNLNTKIQPVGLKIWRPPVAELAVKTLGSEWWLDILTFLFVPCTFYRVKFLPVIEKGELNEHDFAELIRESISKCLHVPMVPMTSRDMMEYEKRYSLEQRRSRIPRPSVNVTSRNSTVLPELSNNTVILRMAQQVKEVLPRVPLNVILQDLAKTHSIDYTISNILEGHIRYVPETNDETSASSSTNSQSSPSADSGTMPSSSAPLSTAASTFAKSANERMQSFQDRKRLLIENARKRYIDKHGLNIAMNNC